MPPIWKHAEEFVDELGTVRLVLVSSGSFSGAATVGRFGVMTGNSTTVVYTKSDARSSVWLLSGERSC